MFSSTGQDLAASAIGGVATLSSTYGTNYAYYGNDLLTDPATQVGNGQFPNGGCSGSGDVWTVQFPPQSGYPQGYPMPVSSVVFINRQDSTGNAGRITAGNGFVRLVSPNGTAVAFRSFTSPQTVSVFTFNDAQTGPVYPTNTAFQTLEANRRAYVRYIRIQATPLQVRKRGALACLRWCRSHI